MAYTYASYQAAMAQLLVQPDYATNADWAVMLPSMIDYAEQRIYRELDLVSTYDTANADCVAGTRTVTIPGSILIVESANVITPAATLPDAGTRKPLQRLSTEALNAFWPNAATRGVPIWYDVLDFTTLVLAPTPDAAYKLEVYGEIRPAALSGSNTTTFLTTYLPDLFVAASMVFGTGWQRDFGAQSDNPQAAQSWENQYQLLKSSAAVEEARRKSQSVGWQPQEPAPLANPSR